MLLGEARAQLVGPAWAKWAALLRQPLAMDAQLKDLNMDKNISLNLSVMMSGLCEICSLLRGGTVPPRCTP
jgi:hypothetical protein